MFRSPVVVVCFIALLLSGMALAQTTTGTISGVVKDETGLTAGGS